MRYGSISAPASCRKANQASFRRSPWVVAQERYLDGLSDEDKALFRSASAENLLYSTSAAQILHKKGSTSRNVAKKLQPLIAAISQYGNAFDVISNTAPFIAPVWGGLRVLLHVWSQVFGVRSRPIAKRKFTF